MYDQDGLVTEGLSSNAFVIMEVKAISSWTRILTMDPANDVIRIQSILHLLMSCLRVPFAP